MPVVTMILSDITPAANRCAFVRLSESPGAAAPDSTPLKRESEQIDESEAAAQVSDAVLYRQFQGGGDAAAFEELFRRHKSALFRFLWALCGSEAIADDLSQYCWMRLMDDTSRGGYEPRPGASLLSFLRTVGRNRYIDEYQRKHVESRSQSMDDAMPLAAPGNDTADAAAQQQSRELITTALVELPLEQREVIALWMEGFSIKEMMASTGAPRDTVLSRKKYAMKKLHSLFRTAGLRSYDEP